MGLFCFLPLYLELNANIFFPKHTILCHVLAKRLAFSPQPFEIAVNVFSRPAHEWAQKIPSGFCVLCLLGISLFSECWFFLQSTYCVFHTTNMRRIVLRSVPTSCAKRIGPNNWPVFASYASIELRLCFSMASKNSRLEKCASCKHLELRQKTCHPWRRNCVIKTCFLSLLSTRWVTFLLHVSCPLSLFKTCFVVSTQTTSAHSHCV